MTRHARRSVAAWAESCNDQLALGRSLSAEDAVALALEGSSPSPALKAYSEWSARHQSRIDVCRLRVCVSRTRHAGVSSKAILSHPDRDVHVAYAVRVCLDRFVSMPWAARRSRTASSPATAKVIRPAPASSEFGSMKSVACSSCPTAPRPRRARPGSPEESRVPVDADVEVGHRHTSDSWVIAPISRAFLAQRAKSARPEF